MKTCISCSNTLADGAAYCYVCNIPQTGGFETFEKPAYNDTFLKVLCILTIIGAAFSLLSVPFSLVAVNSLGVGSLKFIAYLGIPVAIGKLLGAIFMLQKKLSGLYIYTAAAVLSILSSIYSMTVSAGMAEGIGGAFVVAGGLIGLLFLIAFLVMYWLPVNNRLLS